MRRRVKRDQQRRQTVSRSVATSVDIPEIGAARRPSKAGRNGQHTSGRAPSPDRARFFLGYSCRSFEGPEPRCNRWNGQQRIRTTKNWCWVMEGIERGSAKGAAMTRRARRMHKLCFSRPCTRCLQRSAHNRLVQPISYYFRGAGSVNQLSGSARVILSWHDDGVQARRWCGRRSIGLGRRWAVRR
jgi:hypothetical protein